jgi:dipeptidyl aminopeptidase/acylaminoacyl peptidase
MTPRLISTLLVCTLTACLAWAGFTPSLPAAEAGGQARPYLPETLAVDGRLTLTPGFSPDGSVMYFAQTECQPIWDCPQRLMRAERVDDGWAAPEPVALPQAARVDYPSVTPDGRYLLFSWAATRPDLPAVEGNDNFDLWRLDLSNPDAVPELLQGPDLNRIRSGAVRTLRFVNNETAPILTEDGDLYFWSERLDGMGERDVYRAPADDSGGFGAPQLLPEPINSTGRDDGAWISADGRTLLVTYADRGGCGGSDLFIAFRQDGGWTEPVNLGCEINSPDDELAATLIPGTRTLVFPSTRPLEGASSGTVALWTAELPAALKRPVDTSSTPASTVP